MGLVHPQENTLDALRSLIQRDNDDASGQIRKLAYVEWDIHVRCDMVSFL